MIFQMRKMIQIYVFPLYCFVLVMPGCAESALEAKETAILVNSESPESVRIGELYSELRNVPASHIIRIHVPTKEYISREGYDELIAKPVRDAVNELYEHGESVRCIVTTYGIPLKVGAAKPLILPVEEIGRIEQLIGQKQKSLDELRKKRESESPDKELHRRISRMKNDIDNLTLQIGMLNGSDTAAAVDSELALVLVTDYSIAGWQMNPAYLEGRGRRPAFFGQVLMVSRLDAPTPSLAEGLIRTAVEAEAAGLSGRIYLDARGKTGKDAYGQYDEDIRKTAQILRQGLMPVVLDNRPALFQPGEARSAALYCGWYSHRKYVDAFEWEKGAVGYHVASSEAVSLHNPKQKYWVKSMIEKGVTATLGPVSEPYLTAFPKPSRFFPLLMSGRYTLAEVFALTNPFLSWRIILVGDPLYNPFKNNPAYVAKGLPDPPE
jgi:uncharacterized protein (TIGR03790 family)